MAAATYHPQVYRGTSNFASSSSSSVRQSNCTASPIAAAPQTNFSCSSTSTDASARHHTQQASTSSTHQAKGDVSLPAYGLCHSPPSAYPLHPASTSNLSFRLITASQYAGLVAQHSTIKCHERVLFPWLHGADFEGTAQAANFGYVNGAREKVPRFRGLTTIAAHPIRAEMPSSFPSDTQGCASRDHSSLASLPPSVAHSRAATSTFISTSYSTDSFASTSTIASTCSCSSSSEGSSNELSTANSSATSLSEHEDEERKGNAPNLTIDQTKTESASLPYASSLYEQRDVRNTDTIQACVSETSNRPRRGPEPYPSLLTSSWLPADILCYSTSSFSRDDLTSTVFHSPVLPAGISFRHFRLQAPKYASISDIVIFSDRGGFSPETIAIAMRAKAAVVNCARERTERGETRMLQYEVYVVAEPFAAFERHHRPLVAVDSAGYASNGRSFAEREHEEMRAFTKAVEIGENVWLGNTYDVPLPLDEKIAMNLRRNGQDSEIQSKGAGATKNPKLFSICIEAKDTAHMSDVEQLRDMERYLDEVQLKRILESHVALEQAQFYARADSMKNTPRSSSRYFSDSSFSSPCSSSYSSSEDGDISEDDTDATTPAAAGESELEDNSDFEEFFHASDKEINNSHSVSVSPSNLPSRLAWLAPSLSLSLGGGSGYSYGVGSGPIKTQFKKGKSLNLASAALSKPRAIEKAAKRMENEAKKNIKLVAKLQARTLRKQNRRILRQRERGSRHHGHRSMSVFDEDEKEQGKIIAAPLQANLDEIVHLEVISTSQSLPSPTIQMGLLVDTLVEHVMWIRAQARPSLRTSVELRANSIGRAASYSSAFFTAASAMSCMKPDSIGSEKVQPRRVLIHCVDGYTDSSVLSLAYVMYDRVCSLPEAYLHLQNDRHRSFFVYPADLALLKALEKRFLNIAKLQDRAKYNDDLSSEQIAELERVEKEKERAAATVTIVANAASSARDISSSTKSSMASFLSRPSLFSRSSSSSSISTIRTYSSASAHSSLSTSASASPTQTPVNPHMWFYDEKFDGHFPSRILDFLYLGNLSHASNALMLKELGITHVLSIGETALVPPNKQGVLSVATADVRARAYMPTNSLWLEQSLGNINVLDIQDIQDDGVDTILPHIVNAVQYIEAARAAGGKVLVHCRVGVSRSATLVIAYVMRHMDLSLADAYLVVRARRLNILIQPTILFMWTLHMWEEEIRGSAIDEQTRVDRRRTGRLTWPVLAKGIADLNQKYLGC